MVDKQVILKRYTAECKTGEHCLAEIFSAGSEDECQTVRWCEVCGSVVVDVDYIGRSNPGQVMKMRSPLIRNLVP